VLRPGEGDREVIGVWLSPATLVLDRLNSAAIGCAGIGVGVGVGFGDEFREDLVRELAAAEQQRGRARRGARGGPGCFSWRFSSVSGHGRGMAVSNGK
jgi:hypothetical protein